MRSLHFAILIAFLNTFLLFHSCEKDSNSIPLITDDEKYQNAIKDAMIAEQDEICNTLVEINDSNTALTWNGTGTYKKVLVLTWTKYPGSFPENATVTNTWGEVWITIVPEMEDWFKKNYFSGTDFIFRTEQLLGLPKNKGNTHFIELWVKPADLFRPSPDNEITDNIAQPDLPANVDSAYKAWFNNNIIYSYYPMRYPWTRLGYTYDWGNPLSEIGLSEFVIKKNSQFEVYKVFDNTSFFNILSKNN